MVVYLFVMSYEYDKQVLFKCVHRQTLAALSNSKRCLDAVLLLRQNTRYKNCNEVVLAN